MFAGIVVGALVVMTEPFALYFLMSASRPRKKMPLISSKKRGNLTGVDNSPPPLRQLPVFAGIVAGALAAMEAPFALYVASFDRQNPGPSKTTGP